jgi:hypothetical protein
MRALRKASSQFLDQSHERKESGDDDEADDQGDQHDRHWPEYLQSDLKAIAAPPFLAVG